ncbi:hypothetical protein CIK05_11675 [Bdellovibrio sp. qaytius]|nr:hypothetical protein CIK05_11675 [Bdellovibrio sp. qaytius]
MFEFDRNDSHHITEPELVPILDALTSVIFFLVLSTTFVQFTKLTVPPSQTSIVDKPIVDPPLNPKLIVRSKNENTIDATLKWYGEQPASVHENIVLKTATDRSVELETKIEKLVTDYTEKYPNEKTLQIAFSKDVNYQQVITVMDGVRKKMENVVLVSWAEAEQ